MSFNMFKHLMKPITRTKLALVVRKDVKMSRGKTASQCAHAAVLCYQDMQNQKDADKLRILKAWCDTGQPKIVLHADTHDEILELQKRAQQIGIVAVIVRDAGRTQLAPGTATVLGLGPDTVEQIDKLVSHLKLL